MLRNSICLFLTIISVGTISGCGNSKPQSSTANKEIVAYVNREPITASEINKTIALKTRQDPLYKVTPETRREYLDMTIDKKLMIQEAIKLGLSNDEKFVSSIKAYWEQTLVRDFIEHMKKESAGSLYATEAEIKNYYNRLGKRVTFKVLKSTDKSFLEKTAKQIRKEGVSESLLAWEMIGPISYSDVLSDVLEDAFDLPIGDTKIIQHGSLYYLVSVENREEVILQPLENLRSVIGQDILAMKEQKLLDDWLNKKRKQAKIKLLNP